MPRSASLLLNLGSPNSPSVRDVRSYLREFLMDPYVLDSPYLLRAFLVYGLILPFRPKRSAHAYQKIWTEKGSPLVSISQNFAQKVKEKLPNHPLYLAMRYGQPSVSSVLNQVFDEHPDLEDLQICPLYPHYAMSSTKTVVECVKQHLKKRGYKGSYRVLRPFYQEPLYIQALAESVRPYLRPGVPLLLSYHGLPERHLRKTDVSGNHCLKTQRCCEIENQAWEHCYRHHCLRTTAELTHALGLGKEEVFVSFQSRLGRDRWLEPDTESMLSSLAKRYTSLNVLCPAFVADCLETLEEIDMGGRALFRSEGGHHFTYIPCLNEQDSWVSAVASWIQDESKFL